MRHRINPKVDCVFKALLGAEANRALLIHFLNAVLGDALSAPITEAERLDDAALPEWMQTAEMRQAMSTLKEFSEKERAYHAYQARQNYLREQRSIQRYLDSLRAEAEQQRAEIERQRAEADQQRAEADQQRAEAERQRAKAEQEHAEAEQERNAKEAALAEVERLRRLLEGKQGQD